MSESYSVTAILSAIDRGFSAMMQKASDSMEDMRSKANNVPSSTNAMGVSITGLISKLALFAGGAAVMSDAVSRFDTLNKYPVVMKAMGYSTADTTKSIGVLKNGIDGLPTSLDEITKSAQQLGTLTGNATLGAKSAVALNDAFLASGASAADASRGLQQYTQMLSSGKVDMMSWRTLQETMPYALRETAKAFGFTGKAATNDLYKALQSGSISVDQLNKKFMELDKGQDGFAKMARKNSAGIGTSFTNLKNAAVKGMAGMLMAIDNGLKNSGLPNMATMIDNLKAVVNGSFAAIDKAITSVIPSIVSFGKTLILVLKNPGFQTATAGVITFVAAFKGIDAIVKTLVLLKEAFTIGKVIAATASDVKLLSFALANMASTSKIAAAAQAAFNAVVALNPYVLIIAAIIAVVAILVYFFTQTKTGRKLWGDFVSFLGQIWQGLVTIASQIWNAIVQIFSAAVEQVKGIWSVIVEFFSNLWGSIVTVSVSIWSSFVESIQPILSAFKNLWNALTNFFSALWNLIISVAITIWNILVTIMSPIINAIQVLWVGFAAMISAVWQTIINAAVVAWNSLVPIIMAVWTTIVTVVTVFITIIQTVIQTGLAIVMTVWTTMWVMLSTVVSTIWNIIVTIITTVINVIAGVISAVTALIQGNWSAVWNAVLGVASSIWNGIRSIISGAIGAIQSIISAGINAAKVIWNSALNAMKSIVSSIWGTIKGVFNDGVSFIKSVVHVDLSGAGRAIMKSFLDGLTSAWENVKKFVSGIGSWIADHKGPISYDRKLLIPAGNAIMLGLNEGLIKQFKTVQSNVTSMAGQIANSVQDATPILDTKNISNGFNRIQSLSAATFGGNINGSMTLSTSSMDQQNNRLLQKLVDKNSTIVMDTGALVGATADPMNGSLGNYADVSERWRR